MTRRRRVAALALLVAAGVVAALLVADGASPKPGAADATTASGAATVERRDLVDTDTESGTLSYADAHTVYDRLSGTVTWLPHVGQVIRPGAVLFAVDGAPVILMDGSTPAYRKLAPGVGAGRDVLQLNRDLVALGLDPDPIAADDEWQASTTAGVEALQRSLGEATTGRLALGQVVFLPGEQLVAAVDATLGGAGGSGSGSPTASASYRGGAGTIRYASFAAAPPAAAAQTHAPPADAGSPRRPHRAPSSDRVRALEAQLARLKASIARLEARGGGTPSADSPSSQSPGGSREPEGPSGASPTPVLQTTSTRLVVTVQLEASKQDEARVGEAVTVSLPDGATVAGTITAVSAIAQAASTGSGNGGSGAGGSAATVPVTIVLHGSHAGAGLDQATVSVNFVKAVVRDVLTIPVTALLATGGASYAVQEAAAPHRLIAVTPGLFAAGNVEISGPGVHPGLQVSDAQG